jgi:cytoskeleton-associated protein 5
VAALADPKTGSEGRKDLFDWLSKHIPKLSDSSEALLLLKPAASALMVRSSFITMLLFSSCLS